MSKVCKTLAGSDSISLQKQQGYALRTCDKKTKNEICKTADVTGKIQIPASYSLAFKSNVGLNFSELRRTKRCLKPLGIEFENEKKRKTISRTNFTGMGP